METKEFIFKIMVIGDPGVGKTSIIHRFVENYFADSYKPTIGVDFLKKTFNIANYTVTLTLWDVAGQAKYASFKEYYYTGSNFVIVVFDITNFRSYQNMDRWIFDAAKILGPEIEFAIFANKIDLIDQRVVDNYTEFKNYNNLFEFVETSAKTGRNVDELLVKIAKHLLRKREKMCVVES